jgi:hypothetical protein
MALLPILFRLSANTNDPVAWNKLPLSRGRGRVESPVIRSGSKKAAVQPNTEIAFAAVRLASEAPIAPAPASSPILIVKGARLISLPFHFFFKNGPAYGS